MKPAISNPPSAIRNRQPKPPALELQINQEANEESVHLVCQMGGSDKVYDIQLTQSESGWAVHAQNGPRGGTLTAQKAKIENATYVQAKKVFDKLVADKLKGHGDGTHYELVGQGFSPAVTPAAAMAIAGLKPGPTILNCRGPVSPAIVFSPELLTRVSEEEARRYATDPRYLFQTKQDGDRLAVCVQEGKIFGYNKLGQVVGLAAPLYDAIFELCQLAKIDRLLIDGEWEATGYYAWDLLECSTGGRLEDLRLYPYDDRLQVLDLLFGALIPAANYAALSQVLHLTFTVSESEAKFAMLDLRFCGDTKIREGVCIKLREAPYRPGRNGQHKKFKFEQTASFLVGPKPPAKANDGKRSIALYIRDPECNQHPAWIPAPSIWPNRFRYVSTVKVPEKYSLPSLGAIVEIRYVAAYRSTGGIEQPCYFGKIRTDVRLEDCSTGQLKYKTQSGLSPRAEAEENEPDCDVGDGPEKDEDEEELLTPSF